jgi:hypothetical protein
MDCMKLRSDFSILINPANLALRYMNIMIPVAGRQVARNMMMKAPKAQRQLLR